MIKRIGGSPEQALSNDFKLDTNGLLQNAWNLNKSTFLPLLGALVILIFLSSVIDGGLQSYFNVVIDVENESFENLLGGYLVSILAVTIIIFFPMQAALYKMGIRNAASEVSSQPEVYKNTPWMIFNYIKSPFKYMAVETLKNILPFAAFILGTLVHPVLGFALALFLGICLQFSTPLVVQENLSIFKAVKVSFIVIAKKFLPFFILNFVMLVLVVLSSFLLFIPLIWLGPMFFNLIGVVYRDVFGIEVEVAEEDTRSSNENPDVQI